MKNYKKIYNIEDTFGLTEEEFNTRVDLNIRHVKDLVPYIDPDYSGKVERLAIEVVLDEINPRRVEELNELCKMHDEMLDL